MIWKFSLSIIDHAVIAISSFIASLLLIRHAPPAEYGAYALAITALLFVKEVSANLLGGPLTYLGPLRDGSAQGRFTTQIGIWQLAFCLTSSAIIALVTVALGVAGSHHELVECFAMLSICLPFLLAQEFFRRVCIMRLELSTALLGSSAYFSVFCALMLADYLTPGGGRTSGASLDPSRVIGIMGASAAFACIVSFGRLRRTWDASEPNMLATLREAWRFGRWALYSACASTAHLHGIYFLLGTMIGLDAVANFDGPRLLLVPAVQLLMAWSSVAAPLSARIYRHEGLEKLLKFVARASAPAMAGVVSYFVCVMLTPDEWVRSILGNQIEIDRSVIFFWGVIAISITAGTCVGSIFNPVGRPDLGLVGRSIALLASLLLAGPLIYMLGAQGAAATRMVAEVGMTAANFVLAVLLVRWLRSGRRYKA